MNDMPKETPATFRPSIVTEGQPRNAAKDKLKEANRTTSSISGGLGIRLPKSLHVQLNREAQDEGVSL